MRARKERREVGASAVGSTLSSYNSQTKKTKLNSDRTIKFVSINYSKQDLTWIYLDKVTSGPPQWIDDDIED
jgi:hypothetical protein